MLFPLLVFWLLFRKILLHYKQPGRKKEEKNEFTIIKILQCLLNIIRENHTYTFTNLLFYCRESLHRRVLGHFTTLFPSQEKKTAFYTSSKDQLWLLNLGLLRLQQPCQWSHLQLTRMQVKVHGLIGKYGFFIVCKRLVLRVSDFQKRDGSHRELYQQPTHWEVHFQNQWTLQWVWLFHLKYFLK